MIRSQTFVVKSKNIIPLLADFNNCLKLLGKKATDLLQVGSTDFMTNFFPAIKTLQLKR